MAGDTFVPLPEGVSGRISGLATVLRRCLRLLASEGPELASVDAFVHWSTSLDLRWPESGRVLRAPFPPVLRDVLTRTCAGCYS